MVESSDEAGMESQPNDEQADAINSRLDVLLEKRRHEFRRLVEMIRTLNERMDRGFGELRLEMRKTHELLEFFIRTQGEANRQFRATFGLHEDRLNAFEQRDSGA
jgi:hypothetical protein